MEPRRAGGELIHNGGRYLASLTSMDRLPIPACQARETTGPRQAIAVRVFGLFRVSNSLRNSLRRTVPYRLGVSCMRTRSLTRVCFQRAAAILSLALAAWALPGCLSYYLPKIQTLEQKWQMEEVAKRWCATIRASQVIPVYPLTGGYPAGRRLHRHPLRPRPARGLQLPGLPPPGPARRPAQRLALA
jgi:hypothetical protein